MDPLRIGIEINDEQIVKLKGLSETVATTVSSITAQFADGAESADDFAEAAQNLASRMLASNPAIEAQAVTLGNIDEALAAAKAETKEFIEAAGGVPSVVNSENSLLKAYQENLLKVEILSKQATEAHKLHKTSLVDLSTAYSAEITGVEEMIGWLDKEIARTAEATAATNLNTTAIERNALQPRAALPGVVPEEGAIAPTTVVAAVGETSGERKGQDEAVGNLELANAARDAHTGALERETVAKDANAAATEKGLGTEARATATTQMSTESLSTALVANSEEAQAAGRRYYELGAQVDKAAISMKEADASAAKLAATTGVDTEATNRALAAKANYRFLTNEQTAAEKAYQQAMNESLVALQRSQQQQAASVKTVSAPAVTVSTAEIEAKKALVAANDEVAAATQRVTAAEQEATAVYDAFLASESTITSAEYAELEARMDVTEGTLKEAHASLEAAEAKQQERQATLDLITGKRIAITTAEEDAAANEGMVASEVALANAANQDTSITTRLAIARKDLADATATATAIHNAHLQALLSGQDAEVAAATYSDQLKSALQNQSVARQKVIALEAEQRASATSTTTSIQGQTAAISQNNAETQVALSGHARLAQSLLASGMSAEAAAKYMLSLKLTSEQISAAFRELAVAAGTAGNAEESLGLKIAGTNVQGKEQVQVFGAVDKSLAYTAGRMGATELGIGQLGFGFARLATVVPALTAVMDLLFVPFAIIAFGQILDQLVGKFEAIADEELKLNDLSQATGASVAELAELGKVAEATGAKSEDMTAVIKRLDKTISDAGAGSKTATTTLHELGIEVSDWNGKIPATLTVLYQMADYLHLNAGNAEIMTAATRALGTESTELTAALAKGSQGIKEYMERFGEYGTAAQAHIADAKQMKEYEDQLGGSWDKLKLQIEGVAVAIIKYGIDQNPVLVGAHEFMNLLINDWGLYVAAIEKATPALDKFREYEKLPPPPPGTGLSVPTPPVLTPPTKVEKAKKDDKELKDDLAEIAAKKAADEAGLAYKESLYREAYEAHHITLQEELTDLRGVEKEKMEVTRHAFDEEEKSIKAHAKPGDDTAEKLKILNDKRIGEEFKYLERKTKLNADGAREQSRIDQETAINHIKNNETMQKSDDQLALSRADRAFAKAETPPEIAFAGGGKIKAQNKEIDDQIASLQAQQAVLEKGPKDKQGQIIDPKAIEQINQLKAAIHDLENTRQRETEATNAEILTRTNTFYKSELEAQVTALNAQMTVAKEAGHQDEADLKAKLDEHTISLRKYVQEANAVAEEVYQAQHAALEKEKADYEAAAAKKIITAEELARKLAEIAGREREIMQQKDDQIDKNNTTAWKKMETAANAYFKKLNDEMNNTVIQMLQKQKTFAQGMAQIWNDIAQSAIKYMLQMVEKWIETHIIMAAIQKAMAALGFDTGDDSAAKKKIGTAAAVVQADAAMASADVFAQTIAGVPFPADLVAAPIAAAATHAAVMALAAFEQGGIVPGQSGEAVPIMGHAKEMVLPASISSAVQGAIPAIHSFNAAMEGGATSTLNSNIRNITSTSSSVTSSGPRHSRTEVHFHESGKMSHEDIVRSVRLAIRRGEIGI